MPDFYDINKYDLSGTIVGIADKENMLPNRRTKPGNLLIGLKIKRTSYKWIFSWHKESITFQVQNR